MTLGNMRELGVQRLLISCLNPECLHSALLDVSAYPAEITVPAFVPRMVCVRWLPWQAHRRAAELERAAGAAEPDGQAMTVTDGSDPEAKMPHLAQYRMPSPTAKPFGIAIAITGNTAAWLLFAMLGGFTISGAHELTKPHQGKILSEREHRHHEVLKDHFHARSVSEAVP
jgi:hypothetical protein